MVMVMFLHVRVCPPPYGPRLQVDVRDVPSSVGVVPSSVGVCTERVMLELER